MKRKKILFVSAYKTSFVNRDFELLDKSYNVSRPELSMDSKGFGIILILFRILLGLSRSDIAFCWFADIRAYLTVWISKHLRRKSIIVVGGYETTWIPSLNYGALRSKSAIKRVEYIFNNADKVLFVDESLREDALNKLEVKGNNFEILPTNYDPTRFPIMLNKEKVILTVALTETKRTAFIKNLPLFARLSKGFPDWIFKIVGVNKDFHPWLYELGGDNLVIEERMEFNDLLKEYQKAKVYCQLSIREGLPNALCEAMMCGCIPVGSNINGIPKAIGDCGFLCSVGDINAAEKAIDQAILSNLDERGRDRIIELFSTPKRAVRIKELMESL